MNKIRLIGFFSLLGMAAAQAEIQVQLDSNQVNAGEPFRLMLSQSNLQSGGGVPDLTPLRKDFVILGTERSVNYSIINGQTEASSSWIVTLKANKTGTLTIPPIKIGSEETKALTVQVGATAASPQNNPAVPDLGGQQQEDIILTTAVSEKKPYVNQQINYKVTLYNSKQLLDANYQGPKVENALLIPLGNEKRYQIQKNNIPYLVEEQNYAIFPQKSGPLHISSPVFTALVYDFDPQRIKAEDKPITLEVQPIPKEYKGKNWLPAKHVKLSEEYENTGQVLDQGSTLVRTITLEGVGIPAQLLPSLDFPDTDAFRVYPEKGKEKNEVQQGEIVSRTQIKVTYLFNKSGNITIPELKLPWFNTNTGKEEVAVLAPRSMQITPSAATPSTDKTNVTAKLQAEPTSTSEKPLAAAPEHHWAWIAALLALAWLSTLLSWAWQKRRNKQGKGAYKKALNALHEACKQGNPHQARDALLKWANLHWPDAQVLNLNDLLQLTADPGLKKQILSLSQVLYKQNENRLWRGDELWRSIEGIKKSSSAKSKTDVLPPINPS